MPGPKRADYARLGGVPGPKRADYARLGGVPARNALLSVAGKASASGARK
jgi:hypothetical protein